LRLDQEPTGQETVWTESYSAVSLRTGKTTADEEAAAEKAEQLKPPQVVDRSLVAKDPPLKRGSQY